MKTVTSDMLSGRIGARLPSPVLRVCLLIVLAVALAAAGLVLPTGQARAQSSAYHMDRYDTDITVNPDGSLDVVETLVFAYTNGRFHRGLREWDLDKVEGIREIKVAELRNGQYVDYRRTAFDPDNSTSGVPGTYGIDSSGFTQRLRWIYDYVSNDTRTFRISYHADGAIRVYANKDQLDWYGVPPRWDVPVNNSRVTAIFPPEADTSTWATASVPRDAEVSRQGNTITWTANGTINSGGFEVGAEIPKGLLSALKPSWQDSVDQTEGQAPPLQQPEQPGITYTNPAQAWIDLGILLFSVLLIAVGVLWRVVSWYRTGRDKPVVLPADYLAEPPSDLPPGLAGALIDEHADLRDVMSTLVDQARKGAITMAEVQNGAIRDFEYTRIQKKDTMRYPYERMVMSAVFGGQSTAYLSQARGRLEKKLPAIYESMYKSLVHMGYFPESPEQVRNRSGAGCGLLVTLGIVAVLAGLLFGQYLSYMLVFLGMAIVVVALVRVFTKSAMPRKTDKGAEEAERWRAFKRYLQQIQTYTNVQEAADRFQKYLPYAVAMGVDREFINQFNSVPSAMPGWFTPYGYVPSVLDYVPSGTSSGPGTGGGISTVSISPPVSTGAPEVPIAPFDPGGAAQGMSDSFGDAMQGMSNSFTNMVNTASGVFGDGPSGGGGKNSGIGDRGGSSGAGAQIASDIASSVGGLLIGAAISVVFGGGGGGGGGGGAD